MKRLLLLISLAPALPHCFAEPAGSAAAAAQKVPAKDLAVLRQDAHFHGLATTKDLPAEIVALCVGPQGRLAEPGAKWQVTDVISEPNLPGYRLIWAVAGDDYYVVHYESGGYAHTYKVLVARAPKGKKATAVWRGYGRALENYKDFLEALGKRELHAVVE